jgi:hypothetical protein
VTVSGIPVSGFDEFRDPRISNLPDTPIGPEGRGIFPGLLQPWNATGDPISDDNPFRRDSAVLSMGPAWQVMDAVTKGTEYLRALGMVHLPPEPREDQDAWRQRLGRAVLSPYTQRLIENAAGAILRRAIRLEDGDSYWTEVFAKNVDGIGSSLNEYARRLLVSALTYGHSNTLVDFPADPPPETLLQDRASRRRPYFNHVSAQSILGWRQASAMPNSPLTQVRIASRTRVPQGKYGEEVRRQVRVIEPGRYEDFIATGASSLQTPTSGPTDSSTFRRVGGDRYSLNFIPLVPIYTNRRGTLRSHPSLIDIAHINIAHYQRQADFLHALHVAAMPTLIMEGYDEKTTTAGVNYARRTEPGNKVYYVQSDASSFEAQANALLMLEQQMSTLGVTKLLGQKFVAESADAKRIDQAQANSVLSIISMELENALQYCFAIAATYMNIEAPTVRLERDFDFYRLIGQDVSVLGDLVAKGLLSPDAFMKALRAGEVLPDTVDLAAATEYATAGAEDLRQMQAAAANPQQQSPQAQAAPGRSAPRQPQP